MQISFTYSEKQAYSEFITNEALLSGGNCSNILCLAVNLRCGLTYRVNIT